MSTRRLSFAVVILGVALGAAPRKAMAHCRPEPTQSAPSHHHHGQKNTESAPECPHCPPAECRRHAECATAVDSMIVARPPIAGPAAGALVQVGALPSVAAGHPSPPTPPPQSAL